MLRRNIYYSDVLSLRKNYRRTFPGLIDMAVRNSTPELFKKDLHAYFSFKIDHTTSEVRTTAYRRILRLIECDGTVVNELSTGDRLSIHTITYLWQFLRGELPETVSPDLFIDLYYQLEQSEMPEEIRPDRSLVKRQMNRWPTGLDEEVIAIRERNKERIIEALVRKIERRHSPSGRYQFTEGLSEEEKSNRSPNGGGRAVSIWLWQSKVREN